jgi:hypothetical protein
MPRPKNSTAPAKMGAPEGVVILPGTCAPPSQMGPPNGTTNGIYGGIAGQGKPQVPVQPTYDNVKSD